MFINFGQIQSLTDAEALTLDTYQEIETYLKQYIYKASKLDQYGKEKEANYTWEYGNKIVYLVNLLFIIRERIIKDIRNCNFDSFENYKETYKLDCIRKTFSCFPVPFDVNPLYAIFGLDDSFGFEGIAFDSIEIDEVNVCNRESILEVL